MPSRHTKMVLGTGRLSMALVGALVAFAAAPAWAAPGRGLQLAQAESADPPGAQDDALGPASGQDVTDGFADEEMEPVRPAPIRESRHHGMQLGLSMMPGVGYRLIVPYAEKNKSINCDVKDASKSVCNGRSPAFMDLGVAFGVSRRIDLIVDLRFGLEEDSITNSHQFAVSPGLRFWMDQHTKTKLYSTLQMVWDSTDQIQNVDKNDFGARVGLGFMYDPMRNVGFFIQGGATFGFVRWFRTEVDAGIGVQVRFP